MPLKPGCSDDVISRNIAELMRTGKYDPDQAAAIAHQNCRDSKAMNEVLPGLFELQGVSDEEWKAAWAAYQNRDAHKTLYIAPRPLNLVERVRHWGKPGIAIRQAADGRYMFIITSNSYMDREREFITTKALARYVERSWIANDVCKTGNVLLLWHDGDPIGDIVWADMQGPFLLEVAKERDTAFAHQVWDYVAAHPDEQWGASHGFRFEEKRVNPGADTATYDAIDKFETSVLPLRNAANPYTFSGVIDMNDRDTLLDKILGKAGAAAGLRKGVQSVKEELDKQGVEHKAVTPPAEADKGLLDNVAAKVDTFIGQLTDSPPDGLKEAILQLIASRMGEGQAEPPAADPMAEMGMGADESDPMMPKMLKLMDTLTETQVDLVNAVKAIEERQAQQDAAVKALAPINTLAAAFKSMENRLALVEKQLMGRPRGAASAAKETATSITPEQQAQVDKQLTERDPFWGN